MKRSLRAGLLCLTMLLSGCAQSAAPSSFHPGEPRHPASATSAETEPPLLSTCYTDQPAPDAVAARMDDVHLTNGELQVWYWAEIAQYRQSRIQPAPDFDSPLDLQECPINGTDWHQYFLQSALDRWHTAQALIRHSQETPVSTEEAYKPNWDTLHEYLDGMPANRVLYGYDLRYQPNSMHSTYLDDLDNALRSLAQTMGFSDVHTMSQEAFGAKMDALSRYAQDLNYAYMYFTDLTYDLEAETSDTVPASREPLADIRQILLVPERGESVSHCLEQARDLLQEWMSGKNPTADTFAQLASQYSRDPGSAPNGGLYRQLRRDQLPELLSGWIFDEARQEGDTTILSTDSGVHILLFLNRQDASALSARKDAVSLSQQALLTSIRDLYPFTVEEDAIQLTRAGGTVSASDLLYPDIAHERFPEVPLYLQQCYPDTMYGHYKIATNGCGITSLAMIASYLSDDEHTPPEMCARYGRFSYSTGTGGNLFEEAPPELGFYLIKKSYDWREARDYMEQGHPVVVCQYRGYWTGGGHYLVLETLTEDGLVQVRDSNLYNYRKLRLHKEDAFPWYTINEAGQGYWIYEKKVTSTAACTRCGDPEALEYSTVTGYLCEKCETAQLRRGSYLYFPQ